MKKIFIISFLILIVFIIFLLLNLFSNPLTQLKIISDFAPRSDTILIATIDKTESRWDSEKTNIYTYADLNIEKIIKGNNHINKITIRTIGGNVGGMSQEVTPDLSPKFQPQENALIFIGKDRQGEATPLMKYTISGNVILGTSLEVNHLIRIIKISSLIPNFIWNIISKLIPRPMYM